jgi:hypothetical protein
MWPLLLGPVIITSCLFNGKVSCSVGLAIFEKYKNLHFKTFASYCYDTMLP